MGFRTGSYAKVWEIKPVSEFSTKLRISISRKNKDSGEYEQDFAGFVMCTGSMAAGQALALKEGDKIKLGDVDVTTRYDKEKGVEHVNYKVFSFEKDDGSLTNNQPTHAQRPSASVQRNTQPDSGEVESPDLPF